MTDLQDILRQCRVLHDHLCPRQVLGVRIALFAGAWLGLDLPREDKRLLILVETDGCFADGVSAASGCWLGHRTLRLMDYGKVAATFIDIEMERAVRVWPAPTARALAVNLCPEAASRWHAQLQTYQTMPDTDLLCAAEVRLNLSLTALISRPGARAVCDVCGEEILNEREVFRDGETLCLSCADGAYYQSLNPVDAALTHSETKNHPRFSCPD